MSSQTFASIIRIIRLAGFLKEETPGRRQEGLIVVHVNDNEGISLVAQGGLYVSHTSVSTTLVIVTCTGGQVLNLPIPISKSAKKTPQKKQESVYYDDNGEAHHGVRVRFSVV